MKKLVVTLMLVAFAATVAFAANTLTLENSKGNITFDHKAHKAAAKDKGGCKACHADLAKKAGALEGMDAGHALCGTCHAEKVAEATCAAASCHGN